MYTQNINTNNINYGYFSNHIKQAKSKHKLNMIVDRIENISRFEFLGDRFAAGFRFLKENNPGELKEGKHEILGDDVYVIISTYKTKEPEERSPEAHRLYADIQYMISGTEKIGYDIFNGQQVIKDYDPEKDFLLYDSVQSSVTLREGMFAVFFPYDLHQPGLTIDRPAEVKKAVVKVRLKQN